MTLQESINNTLNTLPNDANGAFIELKADTHSASLILEKKDEHWDIKAVAGYEFATKDLEAQVDLKYAW